MRIQVRDREKYYEVDEETGEIFGHSWVEVTYKVWKDRGDDSSLSSLEELKSYCSDPSRENRGDDGYFIDFQISKNIILSDVVVFRSIAQECHIHSYCATKLEYIVEYSKLNKKTVQRSLRTLESLGLIRQVNDHFYIEDVRLNLYWLNPLLHFKGSYWKHRAAYRAIMHKYQEG